MKLTVALKKWTIGNCGIKEDATDDEIRKAVGEALMNDDLTTEKFVELQTDKEDKEANEFGAKLDAIANGLTKLVDLQKPKEEKSEEDDEEKSKEDDEEKLKAEKAKKDAEEKAEPEKAKKDVKTKVQPSRFAKMIANMGMMSNADDLDIRVKTAAEQYSTTKTALIYPEFTKGGKKHPLSGQPVRDYDEGGRILDVSSDREKAVIGAYAKFMVSTSQAGGSRTIGFQKLNNHDKELIFHAMENMNWGGFIGEGDSNFANICNRKLTELEQKQLIDDGIGGASGGVEAVPIVFDDDVIEAPLLHGELYPLVKVVPIDRGRRIEGVSVGKVTGTWGGVDSTNVPLFNTTAYVAAFDTTIFRWEGAFQIGLDFISDSPIDFGQVITAQYGERLLEDLDDVIATGNGTTQPQGIMNSGATAVAFGGVAATLGNYETLRFTVPKNEHVASLANTVVFCGTETSYQRARAIPVGAADARRLGGMDYSSYQWMERPYKINESLTNSQIFYAVLGRYRMYRRRGLVIRTSTEGQTLIRRNEMLIVAMARYGGQLERAAAAALTTTAQA